MIFSLSDVAMQELANERKPLIPIYYINHEANLGGNMQCKSSESSIESLCCELDMGYVEVRNGNLCWLENDWHPSYLLQPSALLSIVAKRAKCLYEQAKELFKNMQLFLHFRACQNLWQNEAIQLR